VSRHRSPGRPSLRSPRSRAAPAVRNGLAAAAVAGGALAVATPLMASTSEPAGDAAALVLTSDGEVSDPAAAMSSDDRADDGVRPRVSVVPVGVVREPEPAGFSVAGLLKSTGLAEAAWAVQERAACDADLDGLGRVRPWARDAAQFLSCLYGQPDLIGLAGRARHSDHPAGLAVDFMMRGERGDRLAACALANRDALGISYVIWERRINSGDGWARMEDRGGDTENHVDHVHVSFERRPGAGDPLAVRCT